jgi:hypothetical protein
MLAAATGDAHNPSMDRWDEFLERFDAALERSDAVIERNTHAFERNTHAFERNEAALDRNTRAWGHTVAAMKAIAAEAKDQREQIRANTRAVLSILDRLDNGESKA